MRNRDPLFARSARRKIRQILSLIVLLAAGGCSWLAPGRFELPEGFAEGPTARRLLDPATRVEAYRELFPDQPRLDVLGALVARGAWWRGSESFTLHYIAWPPAGDGAARPSIYMRGRKGMNFPLFDLTVASGQMLVVVYGADAYFQGPIAPQGSPFGRHVASGWSIPPVGFDSSTPDRATAPPDEDGLVWIGFDKRSGLPREALWRRGERQWRVRYLGWMEFTDDPSLEPAARAPITRLAPSGVEIDSAAPRVRLTLRVDQYRFGDYVSPRLFQIRIPAGMRRESLDRLDEVLE
jgi:hypothetical protein